MAEIKFGFGHINKPTPASINTAVRAITIVLSVFIAWMNTSPLIHQHAQDIINSLAGLIIGLINGLAPLFGIEVGSPVVPAKDVTAIKQ